jgi:hypothetical protein
VLLVRGRFRHHFGQRLMMRQLVMGDLVSNFMGSLVLFMLFELVRPLLFPLMLFVRLELVLLQFFLAQSGACDPA